MNIDPKTDTAVAEEPKGLTEEEIVSLVKGDIQLESLPPEKQDQFHNEYIAGEKDLPTDPEDKQSDPKETGEKPEDTSTVTENAEKPEDKGPIDKKSESDDPEKAALKKSLYEKSNELNDNKQRFESLKKRLDNIEKMGVKKAPKLKDDDIYSEENMKAVHNRLVSLEEGLSNFTAAEKKSINKDMDKLQQSILMNEITKFQLEPESQGLRTNQSFDKLNKLYAEFQNKIGGPENRQKFLTDPEFRKQKEAEGHKFPISEDEFQKYSKIVAVHNFKESRGYPDHSSAYLMWCKENGELPDPVQKAASESSEATTKKIIENSQEIKTLSPTDGQGGSTGITPEQAQAWLTAHPTPSTPDEMKILNEILKKYGGDENPAG